jgi:hypothetical protein
MCLLLCYSCYVCSPHSFLIINVCNQGKTLCSPCIYRLRYWRIKTTKMAAITPNLKTEAAHSFETSIHLFRLYGKDAARDSSVGIATRYGLDSSGFEPRLGRNFPHPSRPVPRPTQPPTERVPGLFHGGKVAGAWSWPSHLAPRLKKEYSYTSIPLWAFMACSRVKFYFYTEKTGRNRTFESCVMSSCLQLLFRKYY